MIAAWIVNGCALLFVVWACRWLRRQRRRRKESRELVISPMAGLALGAMFLGFQAIYQPQIRHMIVEEQKEESVNDESGAEPPGGRSMSSFGGFGPGRRWRR
jgi:hypothetical protein